MKTKGSEKAFHVDIIRNFQATIHNGFEYKLRASGHRYQLIESSDRTTTWQYDSLYRLTNEDIAGDPHGANGNVGYGYDAVGNREVRTGNFATLPDQDFDFTDNDWLTNHTYDSNGNTLQSDGHTDVYDFMNRLIRRTTAEGEVIDIIYNADGDRVSGYF